MDTSDYDTLGDAIQAVPEGGVLVISSDLTAAPFAITKPMTIDLNGHEITMTENTANVIAAEVMIMDTEYSDPSLYEDKGTFTGGAFIKTVGEVFVVVNNGKLILDSGNIISKTTNAIRIQNGGEFVMNNGYIKARETAVLVVGRASSATINNGFLETEDNFVLGGNSNASSGGTNIEVNGGTFLGHIEATNYIACGIHHPQNGNLTINGGTFRIHNGVGVLVRNGQVKITDVNITTTGEASGKVTDSEVLINCNDVCVDMTSTYSDPDNTLVTIEGGTYNAAEGIDSVVLLSDNPETDGHCLVVSGGTFSKS